MKACPVEVCWSEEDLAYLAWVPARPLCRALGENPDKARAALQLLLDSRAAKIDQPKSGAGVERVVSDVLAAPAAVPSAGARTGSGRAERLTRLDAASRQLDGAIRLFLAGGEPLAVHALAAAAGEIFADRLARWSGQGAGDSLPRQDYLRLLRTARELLRPVAGEPTLELDLARNDALIAQAIADRLAACPFLPLSRDMSLFRDWYRAARSEAVMAELPATTQPARAGLRRPHALVHGRLETSVQFSLLPES